MLAGRAMAKALQLVSKRNYRPTTDCQGNFETLLYRRGDHVSARNGGTPALGGAARADRGVLRRARPRPMDGVGFFARANSFSRTPSAFAEFQATTRGTASQAIKALEA